MDQADIPALLSRLASDEDAARKMAVFKLQSSINDPSFADVFISSGGLLILRRLIMTTGGNTLAYSLQSLTRLLEVDMGWDIFEGPTAGDLVERIVELIVTNPLVNILRGAMSILVAYVSHNQDPNDTNRKSLISKSIDSFGFRALKPAIAVYPQFFHLVIQQLSSADHALCANALMLINALIRDAVSNEPSPDDSKSPISPASPISPKDALETATTENGTVTNGVQSAMETPGVSGASGQATTNTSASTGEEWPKFIKRLQDLGLIKAVYNLMQSSALQDLAHPLLEFQSLTKLLLRRWREIRIDLERPEHRRALKGLHLAGAPNNKDQVQANGTKEKMEENRESTAQKPRKSHSPDKWRRLGFATESPAHEFEAAGFLGMMDLTDYVRKNEDGFQKLLLEQSTKPAAERCPVARASLAVTMILFDQFDCDKIEVEDLRGYQLSDSKQLDKLFHPLLLQWSRLHTTGLAAFFRLWKATGAEKDDIDKVAELLRILVDQVVGQAGRSRDVHDVEEDLQEYDCSRLRELQMDLLSLSFDDNWGMQLYQVRDNLKKEALAFVREQRVRGLLHGSWFLKPGLRKNSQGNSYQTQRSADGTLWRFVKLSHNRQFLHHADFALRTSHDPRLDALSEKIDLSKVSSVVSNVSKTNDDWRSESGASHSNGKTPLSQSAAPTTTTKITIFSFASPDEEAKPNGKGEEVPLLTLHPQTHSLASEWLDGLLMLLNQAPITAETSRLVDMVSEFGLKIRLLNVNLETAYAGPGPGVGVIPSRQGLDDNYYYEI